MAAEFLTMLLFHRNWKLKQLDFSDFTANLAILFHFTWNRTSFLPQKIWHSYFLKISYIFTFSEILTVSLFGFPEHRLNQVQRKEFIFPFFWTAKRPKQVTPDARCRRTVSAVRVRYDLIWSRCWLLSQAPGVGCSSILVVGYTSVTTSNKAADASVYSVVTSFA